MRKNTTAHFPRFHTLIKFDSWGIVWGIVRGYGARATGGESAGSLLDVSLIHTSSFALTLCIVHCHFEQ